MNKMRFSLALPFMVAALALAQNPTASRVVDLKASDGTLLKASFFAAAKAGPGVLLFHQNNGTRQSWDGLAEQLAAAGINTLTVDSRGHGESGGKYDNWTDPNRAEGMQKALADIDVAFQFLASQPGVDRNVIGVGGAGLLGVDNSVQVARRHTAEVKSLVLISGETYGPGVEFLHQASQLPELFVVSDNDEYPPTAEAMQLLYVSASSPGKKLVHYSASKDAPWLWYEPKDVGRVPVSGNHGTDLFKGHPELPGLIVNWFVATLITTPGHAAADPLAAGAILNQLMIPGGAAQVTQQLMEARQRDPQAQLFPEISAGIIGSDFVRAGDLKSGIEVLKLVQRAYPASADANDSLADAYLRNGEKELAREYAEKALALLDTKGLPVSSWADTEQLRGEIRRSVQNTLSKVKTPGPGM
jgi:dienelactone hydrolase